MNPYPRRVVISTAFASKPYPRWTAIVDGIPDLTGYGQQEADAVYDLYCQLNERESELEDDQERWEHETGGRS
jgi:hypothetical protein